MYANIYKSQFGLLCMCVQFKQTHTQINTINCQNRRKMKKKKIYV